MDDMVGVPDNRRAPVRCGSGSIDENTVTKLAGSLTVVAAGRPGKPAFLARFQVYHHHGFATRSHCHGLAVIIQRKRYKAQRVIFFSAPLEVLQLLSRSEFAHTQRLDLPGTILFS